MRLVRRLSGRRLLLLLVVALAVAAGVAVRPLVHGMSFVIRAANMTGALRTVADLDTGVVRERDVSIHGAAGMLHARAYEPAGRGRRTALLVSGLHPSGIDEPRLVGLARELAKSGMTIVTPDIQELSAMTMTASVTDQIEAAARGLAADPAFARDGRIGMMGISFSGGLSVVAAGRPSLRDHVAFVFALGGHDDLPRVLRYLCTGDEPGAAYRAPHDYGLAVLLFEVVDRLVPIEQAGPLRAAVRRYLLASALATVDPAKAVVEFDRLKALATTMPEPSATLLTNVNDRDVVHLGPRLLPHLKTYGQDAALSPSRGPKPSAPVFLLHGLDDNVIPADESRHLADDLRGHAPVRLLVSGLISHAEVDRPPHVGDVAELARFWGDVLRR